MSLIWNKQIEANRVVYTRSKGQKRASYLMIIGGLVLLFGIPTLIKSSSFFSELAQQSTWATLFLILMGVGVALIFFMAISMSLVNFRLAAAKRKNKKYEVSSTNDGDVVTIEN